MTIQFRSLSNHRIGLSKALGLALKAWDEGRLSEAGLCRILATIELRRAA
jgi:hypothetical protein